MSKFYASNDGSVEHIFPGEIDYRMQVTAPNGKGGFTLNLLPGHVQVLREYFQHEHDKELGRWRDPKNPDYVVYPVGDDGVVDVLRESSINKYGPGRKQGIDLAAAEAAVPDAASGRFYLAARAYFEAHPEPKPWHDAKPGEVWELEHRGKVHAYMVALDGSFEGAYYVIRDTVDEIVSGRRVWPEQADA